MLASTFPLKASIIAGLAVMVLANGVVRAGEPTKIVAANYQYVDRFANTAQLDADSFSHSEIAPPNVASPNGTLEWRAFDVMFRGTLFFREGTDTTSADRYAQITYRLPIEADMEFRGIKEGFMDFTGLFLFDSFMKTYHSSNGVDWEKFFEIRPPGQFVSYSDPFLNYENSVKYIKIVANNFSLDFISFDLQCETAVGEEIQSFGAIKSMYR